MKIKVFYNVEPVLEIKDEQNCGKMAPFGLHRDRCPDAGWGEFRWGRMENAKEVELTDKLRKILIEDICEYYSGEKTYKKLVELDLIK